MWLTVKPVFQKNVKTDSKTGCNGKGEQEHSCEIALKILAEYDFIPLAR